MTHTSDELGRDGVSEWALLAEAREALEPFVSGCGHTMAFLRSREKMHPAGQDLYLDDVRRARDLVSRIDAMLRARSEGGSDVKG